MPEKPVVKKTIGDDGSITYKVKNTAYVIQKDKHSDKVWYLFKITPTKVTTIFEGKKTDCIYYLEHILDIKE